MNTNFKVDLIQIPTTLDLFHASLAGAVLVLALILVFVLLLMVISLTRKANKPEAAQVQKAKPSPTAKPEIKIVEKIVEVEKVVPGPAPEPVILKEATPDAALQLLSLLQKEARLIDFIKENIAAYKDEEVGAAARVVHEGCNKVISEHFELEPVREEQENSRITLPKGFDASSVRLTGNIVGKPPFTGTLVHKGWKISDIRLPKITEGHNVNVVAAAEVEL